MSLAKRGRELYANGALHGRDQQLGVHPPIAPVHAPEKAIDLQHFGELFDIDPVGPLTPPEGIESHKKIVRGGSWTHSASDARAAARYFYDPYYASGTISFRAARTVFE